MTARRIFGASIAAYLLAWVLAAATYPSRVPVHFGADGVADDFTGKGTALLVFALVGAALAGLFVALPALVARTPEGMLNIPNKHYWLRPENRPRMLRMLTADLFVLGGLTLLLIAVLLAGTTLVADDASPSLGSWPWVALGVYLAAVSGWTAWVLIWRYRVAGEPT